MTNMSEREWNDQFLDRIERVISEIDEEIVGFARAVAKLESREDY